MGRQLSEASAQKSIRVMRKIEESAREKQRELDRLQTRWENHREKLERGGYEVDYNFGDVLA